ncbi:MAG: hypothetical protein KA978_00500 [Deltaproteobacteria bacterium]|nr:hypothetical protein [Deltaproteobacteria bacterium]
MTIQRPDLTPAELQDARDAWMLVQLGQPIPTQYRPAAMKVAAYCFARGYDHDDAAEARPVFIHPDGGREGVPGVFGTNHTWTPTELAAWIAKHAGGMRAKGTGPMFSPGHSRVGDRPEGALTVPLPPLQRGDERCRELGWLFLDADDVGEWTPVLNAIGMHGGAFVRGRSGSHCPPDRKCTMHPKGQTKWHLAVPLRETWTPPGNLNVARATWKGELYAAARFAFHLVAEVSGRGFDRQLDQFLCRMYVGAPYDPKHFSVPREIHGQEGLGFDVRACWAGLEELGVVDVAQVHASRVAATLPPGVAWDEANGEPPMVAAFKVAGLYLRPMASGKHLVVCPFESTHSGGAAGDSSTILWPNGKFLCSHSHPDGKAAGGAGMREVLSMLPPEAQAAHAAARQRARGRERSTPARTETGLNSDDSEGSAMLGDELVDVAPAVSAVSAADELAMLLAALEENPEGALADPFIRRVAALSTADQAKVHAKAKALKVPARPYNAALAAVMKELQREADRVKNEARLAKLAQTKVTINLGPDEDRVTDEAVRALARHPDIYQRAGSLVNVRRDLSPHESDAREKDGPRIAVLPSPTLRDYLSASAVWVHTGEDGPHVVHVPQSTVNAVHARGEWRGIRTLHAVVETPMLRPDGTVLDTPGFDAATGLLYVPNGRFPKVPTHPTREQIDAAKALLFDVVADFPFKEQCHRSAWLSSLLTPLARFAFRGCSPINLIDGNTPGAGKGRLANTVGVVVLGRDIGVMAAGKDDEEQRKAITSKALTGARLVLIDNVDGALGGPALDAALTTTSWEDRLLGGNQMVNLPLFMVWFATGNNIQPRGDLIRRALHIRLESPEDRPEDRANWRHENLAEYVREHRAELAAAALTILRGYCAAGRPAQGLKPWGSFEQWSDLVRGAIVWAGEPDPADTREELRAENDTTGQALVGLVEGWRAVAKRYGGACTARQALDELARNESSANGGNEPLRYEGLRSALGDLIRVLPGKPPTTHQIGVLLRRFRSKPVRCSDGSRLALMQPKTRAQEVAVWTVAVVAGGSGGMRGDDSAPREVTGEFLDASRDGGMGGSGGIPLAVREEETRTFAHANARTRDEATGGTIPPIPPIPPSPRVRTRARSGRRTSGYDVPGCSPPFQRSGRTDARRGSHRDPER